MFKTYHCHYAIEKNDNTVYCAYIMPEIMCKQKFMDFVHSAIACDEPMRITMTNYDNQKCKVEFANTAWIAEHGDL